MRQMTAELLGAPLRLELDGRDDDLLTAGLGLAGLRGAAPAFGDPLAPTRRELRRRAIYSAYRALVDVTGAGGFGRLYGPIGDRSVAGVEYLVAVRTPDGTGRTTVLLQIPAGFDPDAPRLVAVASSGSRGIYGGLPTAAEWALQRGYAVVHTDKGTGVGVWDLDRGRGYRIDGTLTRDPADPALGYVPSLDPSLAEYAAREPHTLLFKHAHSGVNPEADWGSYLLQAIDAAFQLLNLEYGSRERRPLAAERSLVLAVGISNGGAAVLRALERDRAGWISGAVAVEPSAMVSGRTQGLQIRYGAARLADAGIALYDYTSLHYLYQSAAVLAEEEASAPLRGMTEAARPQLEAWCRALQDACLLAPGPIAAAASEARERLLAAGILADALPLGHFNLAASLWPALAASYAWAYARRPPWQPYAGVRFAATDPSGQPRALTDAEAAMLWADGSGIAPTAGISLVARDALGESRAINAGSVGLALAFASDRQLAVPSAVQAGLPADREEMLAAVRLGQEEVVMTACPGNRPVILLHGRCDSLIPVNHSSRAYYAVNQHERGVRDELRYYELAHGQHFDGFLAVPGFAERYVPMQAWTSRCLSLLEARVQRGEALPPSQVIRSRARGAGAPPLTAEHLGTLEASPGADGICFAARTLSVPD